ncbi:partner and localizer of BRCA2 isoform X2 [Pristis pectinata]|uniref:partner and localizer of BRCA2 isoform X2 n=1 Tax=Pristis pectinata TaxID=685728 RepID=UPI00223DD74D|nr:partner and localizer of BRCA2 isoform X2 [Pristis pectinata]
MENSAKKPLNWETREQLKERLALLKKEYAKTVYKLQRAQKAERIQKHVKKTIAHQNRLQEEQSTTQLTVENEYSPILGTYRSDSSLKKGQVPAEEHKEKNSTITFSVVSEIIECSNESLMSMYKSVDSSAQPCSPSVEEMNPITKIEGEFQSRVKLRKKRSCEVLKRAFEVTSESDEPLTANGEPCIKKMETLDPPINNRDINVFQTLDRCVKENTRLKALPQTEDNSALLKNGTQEVEDHCVIMPKGRIASDSNSYGHEDKSTGGAMCSNEAFPSTELTEDAQLQEAKPNCSKNLSETSESNLKDKTVAVEPGELQAGTTVRGSLGGSPLKSCTLVEGLIFPVEYYVRTTRRMTSCQRQVDLDAVIHSHLGKSRNGGKGRPRKLTHDQSSPVEGTPKGEAEICETLLLFNSQEGDGRGSNSTSLQPDLQDSCNVSGDSQSTKSNRRKGRKRGRGECTKFQLTDIHQKSVERNSNDRTVPSDVQISLSSDVQGENEGKKNELNACQTMPDSNKLYGNTVTNTNSHNFSGTYNFNIKNSSLSQDKAKQLVEPQQKSNKIQTNDFKEDLNDQLIVQGAVNVLEPSSTNSDIDSQEMIPETQQDSSVDTSLKKNLNGTRQSFPLGIDLKRGKAESPVSQPKRRVKLSRESSCCKELPRTPEKPGEDINSCVQQIPKTASGHKLSSSILLSTPSCTPQAMNDHQHNQSACSPAFPSLGFTPASGSTGCSPVFSQSSYGNQNSPQTGTLLHLLEDVGNCGQRSQTAAGKASQPDLTPPTPIIKEGSLCVFSGREPLNSQDEEDLNYKCETMFSQQEMPNDDCAEEFSEVDTVIVEKDDILTPALATMKLEQKLEKQMLQLISKIQNPSTSCIIDLCTVFWIVKETRTLCIACACETAVFLWAPQQLNQWTNICTWAFDKVPIIELIPIPDAVNVLCVAFGSLEIREVKVLSSTERGCLEHTLLQAGDINAVLGLAGRRLVCSYGTLQSQSIELNTLSKEGRSEQSMQLVPPNEMVLAFSEVEGQVEALIGSTIMSNIVIWNLKTGHLLKKIHLSESYPGTVCQKAYSQSGILFILLSHRYIGTCEGLVGGQICVLRMVGVNPMNGKNRPIMSYTVPVECSGRYIDGGVKGQSIAAIVTPGTLVLWDVLSGHISTMLQPDTSGDWSLFYWAEEDLCLLARKNDSTVYIYKYLGIRTE